MHNRLVAQGVLADNLLKVWHEALPLIVPALAPNETPGAVLTKLYRKEAQLWTVLDDGKMIAACITEVIHEGPRKVCNIWALGGTGVNNWLGYVNALEAWAKSQDCVALTIARGRPGWQRLLKKFRVTHITLEKEI